MTPFLSILVPSNKSEGLTALIKSLRDTAVDWNNIELVVLVDDDRNYTSRFENIVTIHRIPTEPLNMSELNTICYKYSSGKWIMLGNDDCVMQTAGWDARISEACSLYEDQIALIYPNDGMFGDKLACFPIISRKVIEATSLFPMRYRRYKQDDTIFGMFPANRRIYLENVLFTHLNNKSDIGYHLPAGGIYPIDAAAAEYDNRIWLEEHGNRNKLAQQIRNLIGYKPARVLIGVPTQEFARQAAFYDFLNLLEKPEGTAMVMTHGQSPAKGRNLMIEQAIANNFTHILFIDDDTVFPSDMLVRLLAHDKDIVTGLYLHRNYPHLPLIFDHNNPDGSAVVYFPNNDERGLKRIVNAGLGCVLIKTEVFKAMQSPWITLGDPTPDMWCDDIKFFSKVQQAGFEAYVDLDCMVGHMATVVITPAFINNKWHITYSTGGSDNVSFELPRPKVEELLNAKK